MSTIDILGIPHAYELTPPLSEPSRPVLVFIHGWLLSRHYWQLLVSQLAPHYQCLTYDLRGFGDSQLAAKDIQMNQTDVRLMSFINNEAVSTHYSCSSYSLAAYAQDLSLLLEKLAIQQAWLIGHSLGGSIALWGAQNCPERVKGVICLNSGGGIYLKEEFERFRLSGQQMLKRRPTWLSFIPLMDWMFARIMVKRPLELRWGRQRLIDFIKANQEAALGALLESTTKAEVHRLPQVVARLQQPVYFLAGKEDQVMEAKYVQHLASFHQLFATSGGNVLEIPECGHLAMLEQPDTVREQIALILDKHPA